MTVEEMRNAIAGVYPGLTWKQKVAAMHDDQVTAIYLDFQAKDKFNKKPVIKKRDIDVPVKGGYHTAYPIKPVTQMSIFDIC